MTRNARGRRPEDGDIAVPRREDDKGKAQNDPANRGLRHSFLHNQSVQVRVAGLVLIPLLGALVFGSSVFYDALRDLQTASTVERNAQTVRAMLNVVDHLQDERDITSLQRAGISGDSAVVQARDQSDAAIAALQQRLIDLPTDDESPIHETTLNAQAELANISEYREGSVDSYRLLIRTLLTFIGGSGAGLTDPDIVEETEVLNSLARATEAASVERGLLSHLLAIGAPVEDARNRFVTVSRTEQDLLLDRYAAWAPPESWVEYSEARRSVEVLRRDALNPASSRTFSPNEWYTTSSERIDVMRALQGNVADSIVERASDAASSARLAAAGAAAMVVAMLVLTIMVAFAVARSIVRPLRRLRGAALEAADTGLPRLVSRIQEDGPAAVRNLGDAVTPEGTDEIGQLASAFNEVHATAIRVAGEQALLRQNLDTIVVNLSRRTQSLIDRQLGEIEDLESRERDPDQLGTLFRIDHLATRVRRHAESLLVLAGVEEMRRQGVAAPVLDVVRTAVGEVEQYPRIKFGVMPTDLVVPSAVDDVAHLLAELLDNATEFSAPSTAVTVTSQPLLGGGLRLQVTDQGLGIPADQLAILNERLREPGDIDVAASRTLGIYVVARLAARHGITVRLIPAEGTNGTIAQVDLPSHLIVSPLDTTDGVLPAIQPTTPTPRTESLLNRPGGRTALPSMPPDPSRPVPPPTHPTHPAKPGTTGGPGAIPQPSPAVGSREFHAGRPGPTASPEGANLSRPNASAHAGPPTQPGQVNPLRPPAAPGSVAATGGPAAQRINRPAPPSLQPPAPGPRPSGLPTRPIEPPTGRRPLRAPEPELPPGDSPIFDAVQSAWFKRGGSTHWSSPADEGWRRAAAALRSAESAAAGQQPPSQPPSTERIAASGARHASAAQPGRKAPAPWTAAQAQAAGRPAPNQQAPVQPVGQPGRAGGTHAAPHQGQPAGLPVRQRGATLVPGSIPGAEEQGAGQGSGRRADASNVASTLSNLQRGVSRGREESGGWVPKRPGDSERSDS